MILYYPLTDQGVKNYTLLFQPKHPPIQLL